MRTITAKELRDLRERGDASAVVVDVLPSARYRQEHIPGAVNAPLEADDFVQQVDRAVGDRSETVVVYCGSAECDMSPKAARKLESEGFKDVVDFEGGIKGWKQAGYRIEGAEAGSPSQGGARPSRGS